MYLRNLLLMFIHCVLLIYIVYMVHRIKRDDIIHKAMAEPLFRFVACVALFYIANYDLLLGLLLAIIFIVAEFDVVYMEKYPLDR